MYSGIEMQMQGNAQTDINLTPDLVREKWAYDEFLTYSALGGLIIDDDSKMRKVPIYEFCHNVGIDQKTTWRWKRQPGFADKVRIRRYEVMPKGRESMWFNQLHLLGMQSQDKRAAVDALKTLTGHFSELQLPVQRQDIKVQGGLTEILRAAQDDGIIEGETIEPSTADTTASEAAPGSLPLPS